MLEKTLLDTKRILRPNGLLVITTGLPSNIRESVWFLKIHPVIAEILSKCTMAATEYLDVFAKYGYRCASAMNILATPTSSMISDYWNPEGPLSEEWRLATSFFEVPGRDKVKQMVDIAQSMKNRGILKEFMEENDHTSERGLFTIFVCIAT